MQNSELDFWTVDAMHGERCTPLGGPQVTVALSKDLTGLVRGKVLREGSMLPCSPLYCVLDMPPSPSDFHCSFSLSARLLFEEGEQGTVLF